MDIRRTLLYCWADTDDPWAGRMRDDYGAIRAGSGRGVPKLRLHPPNCDGFLHPAAQFNAGHACTKRSNGMPGGYYYVVRRISASWEHRHQLRVEPSDRLRTSWSADRSPSVNKQESTVWSLVWGGVGFTWVVWWLWQTPLEHGGFLCATAWWLLRWIATGRSSILSTIARSTVAGWSTLDWSCPGWTASPRTLCLWFHPWKLSTGPVAQIYSGLRYAQYRIYCYRPNCEDKSLRQMGRMTQSTILFVTLPNIHRF